jgi:hypothetical protein
MIADTKIPFEPDDLQNCNPHSGWCLVNTSHVRQWIRKTALVPPEGQRRFWVKTGVPDPGDKAPEPTHMA